MFLNGTSAAMTVPLAGLSVLWNTVFTRGFYALPYY